MKALRTAMLLAGLLAAIPVSAAQQFIAISDSLAANADKLEVKEGSQWMGRTRKWRIGDYAVVSSRLEATRIKTKSNLFKTKSERHSTTKFAFVLRQAGTDSASVSAVRRAMDDSTHEMKVTKSVGLGSNDLTQASDSCTAVIVVNGGDSTETWTLFKIATSAPRESLDYRAFLTNGTRTIVLTPVRSKSQPEEARHKSFFSRLITQFSPPAMGYEFIENGNSICALQTSGGGPNGGSRAAWMHRNLDARLRLVLAAAMTTVLQVESSATGLESPDEE